MKHDILKTDQDAFERGMDETIKIQRLVEEVFEFKHRVLELEKKNSELKLQLGEMPF
ncbi:hypothetical protein ACP8HI_10235 [Paenibacillus sp. FA6]|uniref:hypothetical protein n=1 Tax=Paenibacillus sp. FA6 TaxID=3413029 RepID=UPI003F65E1E1